MKAKRAILSVGIAILFVLFVAYAIETIYPSPDYDDFCDSDYVSYSDQATCEANNGKWRDYEEGEKPRPVLSEDGIELEGYCDVHFYCREDFDNVEEKYNRNIFFVSLIIGLITIVVAVLLALESVSAGFMGGGVFLIVYGTIRYWGSLSDVLRTLMLGLTLAVLVWIGYKKIK